MRMKPLPIAVILLAQAALFSNGLAAFVIEDANQALQDQNIEQAIRLYQQGLLDDPQSLDAKVGLAYCYFYKGQYQRATEWVSEVLEVDRLHVKGQLLRGRLYLQEQNLAAAKTAFQQVIGVDPDNIEAHKELGNVLYSLGDQKRADDHYNKVRSLSRH